MDISMSPEEAVSIKTTTLDNAQKKIIVCATCNKGFSCYSNLKKHMKIHSNEKLYACEHMAKVFWAKIELNKTFENP